MPNETRYQLTFLLLLGFDLSDERWENGFVGWVDGCADDLAAGRSASYYRHELGLKHRSTSR